MAVAERVSLAELQNEYVVCRTVGHRWDEYPGATLDADLWRLGGAAVVLRCTRCATERYDYLSATDLSLLRRYYLYPPGYRTARGQVVDRPSLYAELLSRSLLLRRYTDAQAARTPARRRRAA